MLPWSRIFFCDSIVFPRNLWILKSLELKALGLKSLELKSLDIKFLELKFLELKYLDFSSRNILLSK